MLTWQNGLVALHSWHTITLLTAINLAASRSLHVCVFLQDRVHSLSSQGYFFWRYHIFLTCFATALQAGLLWPFTFDPSRRRSPRRTPPSLQLVSSLKRPVFASRKVLWGEKGFDYHTDTVPACFISILLLSLGCRALLSPAPPFFFGWFALHPLMRLCLCCRGTGTEKLVTSCSSVQVEALESCAELSPHSALLLCAVFLSVWSATVTWYGNRN